jgi:hypothetical protein
LTTFLPFFPSVTFCLETKSNQKVQVGGILSTLNPTAGPELRFLPTDVPKYNFPEVKIFNQNQLRQTAPKRAE